VVLRARGLGYRYPTGRSPVVDGLDFEIAEGEIFGFLGPNGAGKSTTQKVLTRILTGYDGVVEVFGRNLKDYDRSYYNDIGVSFEFPNLYRKLTAEENLEFYRRLFDVETESPRELLERLDLPVSDRRPVAQWSKGMQMRLVLGRSLLNRPRLWFLDEPTTGQDPRHAVLIRKLVRERASRGTTVFLTTHDMTVADELCDRVAFLVEGRIAAVDTPRRWKLAHRKPVVRVELVDQGEVVRRDFHLDDEREKDDFLSVVRDRTTAIETIHTLEPSLEDVFLEVTGRGLQD
jgi:fluoroquinolone transport system ATP-binding protein